VIRVPVPASWLTYIVHPSNFNVYLKRIDLPDDLPEEVKTKLTNVDVPLFVWTGCDDNWYSGASKYIHFILDDSDAEFAALFKLTYL
jgi:hypothetical protein